MEKILNGDTLETLKTIPSVSVQCIISSPPYNVGIEYDGTDDNKPWDEYWNNMVEVIAELYRVLSEGGRVVWNVSSWSSRQSLYHGFWQRFEDAGFKVMADIIWDKKQISSRTAWGSFASASEPNILPRHEHITVFYKGNKNKGKGESTVANDNFVKWTDGMWEFAPETNSEHPAPFPLELPNRAIEMFTFKEDVILDPYCGYGTTLRAAKNLGRGYIGIDASEKYCDMARRRMEQDSLFQASHN